MVVYGTHAARHRAVDVPQAEPTSGPCSADESVAFLEPFPVLERPILPWAYFPSKVLPRPSL
jgi:hypothetical protein